MPPLSLALTVHQPYADWLVRGTKPLENRPWRPAFLKPEGTQPQWVGIHAGKGGSYPKGLSPRGYLIGAVYFDWAVRVEEVPPSLRGPHALGPYCWHAAQTLEFAPEHQFALKGSLGLWPLPPDVCSELADLYPVLRQWLPRTSSSSPLFDGFAIAAVDRS